MDRIQGRDYNYFSLLCRFRGKLNPMCTDFEGSGHYNILELHRHLKDYIPHDIKGMTEYEGEYYNSYFTNPRQSQEKYNKRK
jgi:hypothetical protein